MIRHACRVRLSSTSCTCRPRLTPNTTSSSPSIRGARRSSPATPATRPVAYRTSVATSAASGTSSHHSDRTGSERATWSAATAISPTAAAPVICRAFRMSRADATATCGTRQEAVRQSDIRPRPPAAGRIASLPPTSSRGAPMGERTSHEPGTFSWVDLSTSDPADAKRFYGGLFGWTFDDLPVGDGVVYTMCQDRRKECLRDLRAAGAGALAGHPAALEQLRDRRGRGREHGEGEGARRQRDRGALRRARRGADVGDRGSDRRGSVRVAATQQHRRGAGERPRRADVE